MKTITEAEFRKKYGQQADQAISTMGTKEKERGLGYRIADDIKEASSGVNEAISGTGKYAGKGTIARSVGATAEAFNAIPNVAIEALPRPARKAVGWAEDQIGKGFQSVTDALSDTKLFREIGALESQGLISKEKTPGFYRLIDALSTASSAGQISGDILITDQASKATQAVTNTVKNASVKAINTANKITGTALEATGSAASKAVGTAMSAENIMQRVARIPKSAQSKFKEMSGESVGEYLNKRSHYGSIDQIIEGLYKRFTQSKNAADDAIGKLAGNYKPVAVKDALKELSEREVRISTPGAKSADFDRIQGLNRKFDEEGLTMAEINEVKRIYERTARLDYLKQNLPEAVARANNIDNAIRSWQFLQAERQGLKNLPSLNKETRLAKFLIDEIGKEYAGSAGNNAISLTDFVLLSGGSPEYISAFLAKKILSSKKLQSAVAKKLYSGKKVGMPVAEFTPQNFDLKTLPSPRYIEMGAQTTAQSTPMLVPAKAISIKNPKTGRYEKAYTSEARNRK